MIDVVSVKFKSRGKSYFFSPNGLDVQAGEQVIVETSKGMEIVDCCRGNHEVPEAAVVQPLRPVLRIATADDKRIAEMNKKREKEAFEICQKKIAEHKLDMKLVDVECNFEGNKTMFFFTSDGRVDFRELVKDLAGIFRNRIELRQIGVRDEAKLLGGIGICGRPYCCNQFLDDFQPVSTKMAKVQSLSLNPTKISGSCGRLMCCLRYEQEAYEELIKKVPKQGAFVETKDGYGTAVQVNLLRQTVNVRLDKDTDSTLHSFKPNELAAVPGGRPRDGEPLPSVLKYVPEEPEEDEEELTPAPRFEQRVITAAAGSDEAAPKRNNSGRNRRPKRPNAPGNTGEARAEGKKTTETGEASNQKRRRNNRSRDPKVIKVEARPQGERRKESAPENGAARPGKDGNPPQRRSGNRRRYKGKPKGNGEGNKAPSTGE